MAVNVTEAAPAGTVAEAGTLNAGILLDRVSAKPPDGAAPLRAAVQLEVPGVCSDPGVQDKLLRVTAAVAVMIPPDAVMPTLLPVAEAPRLPLTAMEAALADGASVALTTAMTPLARGVEFMPVSTHMRAPLPEVQLSDLPAAVTAGDALAVMAAISAGEYASIHWTAEVCPPGEFSERFKEAAPPAIVLAEESASESDCPQTGKAISTIPEKKLNRPLTLYFIKFSGGSTPH